MSPYAALDGTTQQGSPRLIPMGISEVSHSIAEGIARQTARSAVAAAAAAPDSRCRVSVDSAPTAPQLTSRPADATSPPWQVAAIATAAARRTGGASAPSSWTKLANGGGGLDSTVSGPPAVGLAGLATGSSRAPSVSPRSMARTEWWAASAAREQRHDSSSSGEAAASGSCIRASKTPTASPATSITAVRPSSLLATRPKTSVAAARSDGGTPASTTRLARA
mmetsp:Transcript_36998/g.117870  ORF Transcript_36998/g.117870 Transcript_36998/m.117870 type:complete len:223 (-) Transcript_36998:1283-1951(-)